jgi:hypothetical protein
MTMKNQPKLPPHYQRLADANADLVKAIKESMIPLETYLRKMNDMLTRSRVSIKDFKWFKR